MPVYGYFLKLTDTVGAPDLPNTGAATPSVRVWDPLRLYERQSKAGLWA